MHKDLVSGKNYSFSDNQHRIKLTYYFGSAFFAIGIAILAVGVGCIVYFKIHYLSLPEEILITSIFLGASLITILTGINLMMHQTKYGHFIVFISSLMSFGSLVVFYFYYPHGWYYPLISYVLLSYILGFLLLIGNAFANVILAIIGSSTGPLIEKEARADKFKEYTDEEINRDIDKAVKRSMEIALNDLKFSDEDFKDIKVGKAFRESRGTMTRVKDDINEVITLKMAINPRDTEEQGSKEVDDISAQLDKFIMQDLSENGKKLKPFEVKRKRFRLFS